jgi:hypothetical protein
MRSFFETFQASPVKRPAEDAAESHEDSGEDDKPKAKRGRGRPKGSGGGAKAAKSPKAKKVGLLRSHFSPPPRSQRKYVF